MSEIPSNGDESDSEVLMVWDIILFLIPQTFSVVRVGFQSKDEGGCPVQGGFANSNMKRKAWLAFYTHWESNVLQDLKHPPVASLPRSLNLCNSTRWLSRRVRQAWDDIFLNLLLMVCESPVASYRPAHQRIGKNES